MLRKQADLNCAVVLRSVKIHLDDWWWADLTFSSSLTELLVAFSMYIHAYSSSSQGSSMGRTSDEATIMNDIYIQSINVQVLQCGRQASNQPALCIIHGLVQPPHKLVFFSSQHVYHTQIVCMPKHHSMQNSFWWSFLPLKPDVLRQQGMDDRTPHTCRQL